MAEPKYKRILLKLSGEALSAGAEGILNFDFIATVAGVLKKCIAAGVEIGVIVGAGNIWRAAGHGDGSGAGRPYGHACHRNQRTCFAGRISHRGN